VTAIRLEAIGQLFPAQLRGATHQPTANLLVVARSVSRCQLTLITDDSGLSGGSSRQSAIAKTLPRSWKSRERSAQCGEPSVESQSGQGHPPIPNPSAAIGEICGKKLGTLGSSKKQRSAPSHQPFGSPPSALRSPLSALRFSRWPKLGTSLLYTIC
jgi:hypothetical protein